MDYRISATDLARRLGDILGRIRYRRDRFVVEKHGVTVAHLVPPPATGGTLADALAAWRGRGDADTAFADALERIGKADRPPGTAWGS